ncbi:cbb3-type cytochrome c oxidase subunit 3 [Sinimarinibacterium sp. NLF-5-8]|uniref:cbb3-type cytochrome oxidase subunit 3 n=1 Tax=Sinimarinibacterium sp. NLF-5-8 TaxID=2698684 RepID=UPI00192E80BF|nr:cbb3-type cytochrome c oxidase subunit 3 [Sinimarinibacterium sp. NLF-5-8]
MNPAAVQISPFWGNAIGVMIVLMLLVFIGIWVWAWGARHKPTFDRLSRLPMEDDELVPPHSQELRS